MYYPASQQFDLVRQWALGPTQRQRFLLAGLASPNVVSPPSLTMTMAVTTPTVTSNVTPSVVGIFRPVVGTSTTMWTGRGGAARQVFLAPLSPLSSAAVGKSSSIVFDTIRVLPNSKAPQKALLSYQGAGTFVYPPGLTMSMAPIAPVVNVMSLSLMLSWDDGAWPPDQTFVYTKDLRALQLAPVVVTFVPPTLQMTMTAVAPTVVVSSNTIITPPSLYMTMTALAPTITMIGAPIITPSPLFMTMSVVAPSIAVSNFGVNPPSLSMRMTVVAPYVSVISYITVVPVGRIVIEPKLVGVTEVISPPFDFSKNLQIGETLSTASVGVSVYSGVDPNPSALLSGTPSISGAVVNQSVTGGIVGVIYDIICTATTSLGNTYQLTAYLYVEPPLP